MPEQLIQFRDGDGASSSSLQALILALAGRGPVRMIGNIAWKFCRICVRGGDRLRSRLGMTNRPGETLFEQVAYPATGSDPDPATAQPDERRSAPAIHALPLPFQPATDLRRTDQTAGVGEAHIFIEVVLPPVPSDQAATADIALPVLLPDFLDSSETSPAQFFEEHFRVYVESDSVDRSTALCLVDPTGQLLFSSDPDPTGTLPAAPASG